MNIWVYKFDGTIQCDNNSEAIPLDIMEKDLAMLIGQDNIIDREIRSVTMIQLCGEPTGTVNAYKLTYLGYHILMNGFVGPNGFKRWTNTEENRKENTLAQLDTASIEGNSKSLQDLIGKSLRVYHTGDALTSDWRPERANIELNADGKIVDIWLG